MSKVTQFCLLLQAGILIPLFVVYLAARLANYIRERREREIIDDIIKTILAKVERDRKWNGGGDE